MKPRKTSEIVAGLRDIADGHDADGQTSLGDVLREAANRLENASTCNLQKFASVNGLFKMLFDPAFWLRTFRDAIADGSIDEMVKK